MCRCELPTQPIGAVRAWRCLPFTILSSGTATVLLKTMATQAPAAAADTLRASSHARIGVSGSMPTSSSASSSTLVHCPFSWRSEGILRPFRVGKCFHSANWRSEEAHEGGQLGSHSANSLWYVDEWRDERSACRFPPRQALAKWKTASSVAACSRVSVRATAIDRRATIGLQEGCDCLAWSQVLTRERYYCGGAYDRFAGSQALT